MDNGPIKITHETFFNPGALYDFATIAPMLGRPITQFAMYNILSVIHFMLYIQQFFI